MPKGIASSSHCYPARRLLITHVSRKGLSSTCQCRWKRCLRAQSDCAGRLITAGKALKSSASGRKLSANPPRPKAVGRSKQAYCPWPDDTSSSARTGPADAAAATALGWPKIIGCSAGTNIFNDYIHYAILQMTHARVRRLTVALFVLCCCHCCFWQ